MNDITPEAVLKLKALHPNVHPLVFHRTLEKARSVGDLFEMLRSVPKCPIVWDDSNRSWKKETDILGRKKLKRK